MSVTSTPSLSARPQAKISPFGKVGLRGIFWGKGDKFGLVLIIAFLFFIAGCAGRQKTPPAASGVPQAEAPRSTEAKPEPEVAEEKKPGPPAVEVLALPKFERV